MSPKTRNTSQEYISKHLLATRMFDHLTTSECDGTYAHAAYLHVSICRVYQLHLLTCPSLLHMHLCGCGCSRCLGHVHLMEVPSHTVSQCGCPVMVGQLDGT